MAQHGAAGSIPAPPLPHRRPAPLRTYAPAAPPSILRLGAMLRIYRAISPDYPAASLDEAAQAEAAAGSRHPPVAPVDEAADAAPTRSNTTRDSVDKQLGFSGRASWPLGQLGTRTLLSSTLSGAHPRVVTTHLPTSPHPCRPHPGPPVLLQAPLTAQALRWSASRACRCRQRGAWGRLSCCRNGQAAACRYTAAVPTLRNSSSSYQDRIWLR